MITKKKHFKDYLQTPSIIFKDISLPETVAEPLSEINGLKRNKITQQSKTVSWLCLLKVMLANFDN